MDSLTMRQTQVQVRVNSFVRSVYNWMAIGLALTGFIAYAVANMPEVRSVIFGSGTPGFTTQTSDADQLLASKSELAKK